MRTTVRVKFHLPQRLHDEAMAQAKSAGMSLAEFCRRAVGLQVAGSAVFDRTKEDRAGIHKPTGGLERE